MEYEQEKKTSRLRKRQRNKSKHETIISNVNDIAYNEEDFIESESDDEESFFEGDIVDDIRNDTWKEKIPQKELPRLEKKLKKLINEMEYEIPTIPKILNAFITKADKKKCLRLYDQLSCHEVYSNDYYRVIDSINDILRNAYSSQEEVNLLEKEEDRLRSIYLEPDNLKNQILKLNANTEIKAKLLSQYEQMMTYPPDSSFHLSLREEIEWALKLPYEKSVTNNLENASNLEVNKYFTWVKQQLDVELYGMDDVKQRIIQILNDRRTSGNACGRNLALVGPPGVGKTAICKVLGKILGKRFAKISSAALDKASIKGHNKVWTSSEPSIILQIMADLKTNDALIMFDEIDKVDKEIQHALLHVSDTADNKEFQDNYLKNFSHDLSKIFFVYCMNSDTCLDEELKDRFDIVYLNDYNIEEKVQISKNFMLPKALTSIGMNKGDVCIPDPVMIKYLESKNVSLRTMERTIKSIIGKINLYRSVVLKDGTTGNLKLPFTINKFKLPLRVDEKLFKELL